MKVWGNRSHNLRTGAIVPQGLLSFGFLTRECRLARIGSDWPLLVHQKVWYHGGHVFDSHASGLQEIF